MLVQLNAEVQDTLTDDLRIAQSIAKQLNVNVSFYFDRVEYYVNAGGEKVSTRKSTLEVKQEKKGK